MGQVLHSCATTTEAIRRAIQHSQESLRSLSRRYGINPKTVAKWKKRGFVADLPTGPREPKSAVLSVEDEAIVVAFRRHTLLPLDDCLYALQARRSAPLSPVIAASLSSTPRHLPASEVEDAKAKKRRVRSYPMFFHIHCAKVRTKEDDISCRIDRTSSMLSPSCMRRRRGEFSGLPQGLIKAVPYKIHCVLTMTNGTHFTEPGGKLLEANRDQGHAPAWLGFRARTVQNSILPRPTSTIASPSPSILGPTASRAHTTAPSRRRRSNASTTRRTTEADHLTDFVSATTSPSASRRSTASPYGRVWAGQKS